LQLGWGKHGQMSNTTSRTKTSRTWAALVMVALLAGCGAQGSEELLMTENGAQRQFQLVTPEGTVVLESWNEYFNN